MLLSEPMLAFVQRCQVAIGQWPTLNEVDRLGRVWECVLGAPRSSHGLEKAAFVIAISRIAAGFLSGTRESCGEFHVRSRQPLRQRAHELLGTIRSTHANTNVTLAKYAQSLRLSRSHLSRLLVGESGFDFRTHLNGIRVLHAARLLNDTRLSVKEVAANVGYEHTAALDRQFKHWLGMTPGEFRRTLQLHSQGVPRDV